MSHTEYSAKALQATVRNALQGAIDGLQQGDLTRVEAAVASAAGATMALRHKERSDRMVSRSPFPLAVQINAAFREFCR